MIRLIQHPQRSTGRSTIVAQYAKQLARCANDLARVSPYTSTIVARTMVRVTYMYRRHVWAVN
jgi:hypothetical protein